MPTIRLDRDDYYVFYGDNYAGARYTVELTDDEYRQFKNAEVKFWRAQDMIEAKLKIQGDK